jgi:hypothetical protein
MGTGCLIFDFLPHLYHISPSKSNPHQAHPTPFLIQNYLSFYQTSQDYLQNHLKFPISFKSLKTHPLRNQTHCLSSSGTGTVFRTLPKVGIRNVLVTDVFIVLMVSVALGWILGTVQCVTLGLIFLGSWLLSCLILRRLSNAFFDIIDWCRYFWGNYSFDY